MTTISMIRKRILEEAIRGKLVPQNDNEEHASDILKKLQEKRQELYKQNKTKNPTKLPEISEGEKPFELPNRWEWVRFGDITINRDGERIPLSKDERENKEKIYDYYGASGIIDKVDSYLFEQPLLLIGEDGANLVSRSTPIAFIADGKYWVNNHAHVVDSLDLVTLKYLSCYINGIDLKPYLTGSAQPKLNQAKLNMIVVALPPYSEMEKVVRKVEELNIICDQWENEVGFQQKQIVSLHEKVFSDAIRGFLIPQNEKDEPASILLENIQNEKEQLIKMKRLKKTKPLPPIEENEIPFEIPNGWAWVRLGEIIELLSGRDLTKKEYNDSNKGIPYIMGASNIINGSLIIERWTENPTVIGRKGDLLISVKGTIGKLVIQNLEEVHLSRQIMGLRTFYGIDVKYLMYYMNNHVKYLQETAKGFIPGISREDILLSVFPLPPFEEQKRIVQKIENIFSTLNEIERNIIMPK